VQKLDNYFIINIMDENIILSDKITLLDNKLSYYDMLYKKWCRKTDLILKNIHIKFQVQNNIVNYLDKKLNSKINKLELRLHKSNKLIIYLMNKSKKSNEKTQFEIIIAYFNKLNKNYYIISLFLILFFIIIYYI